MIHVQFLPGFLQKTELAKNQLILLLGTIKKMNNPSKADKKPLPDVG